MLSQPLFRQCCSVLQCSPLLCLLLPIAMHSTYAAEPGSDPAPLSHPSAEGCDTQLPLWGHGHVCGQQLRAASHSCTVRAASTRALLQLGGATQPSYRIPATNLTQTKVPYAQKQQQKTIPMRYNSRQCRLRFILIFMSFFFTSSKHRRTEMGPQACAHLPGSPQRTAVSVTKLPSSCSH